MREGTIKRGGINVPVFEAKALYEVYLGTPDSKFSEKEWTTRVNNLKAEMEQIEKYPGLKVGSMDEATTDGNWEKL